MVIESLVGLLFIHIGVTVNTAVRAGVIRSNVRALGTAALFSCGFFFVHKTIGKEQSLDNTAVDTMGFFDAVVY